MISFVQRHLDRAGRLGEILFGLIMALGIIGAVRIGVEEPNNREMFIAVLGCNLAWAIVDGVMYVLVALFERGRRYRIATEVQSAGSDERALELIRKELDGDLEPLASSEGRTAFYQDVLKQVRAAGPLKAGVKSEDMLGGVASAVVILLATAPILVPYLVLKDPMIAVRSSEIISVVLLFLLGAWWGKVVGAGMMKIGLMLTAIGGALVVMTILLGG